MQTQPARGPESPAAPLMVSISGVRGIVGTSLTPDVVVRYAAAFAALCRRRTAAPPSIVIGRDGRAGGQPLYDIIGSTLLAAGVDVRLLGIAPTPTVAFAVEHGSAAGGISVTASHNPLEWNGMKFFAQTGLFLDAAENSELQSIVSGRAQLYASWENQGTASSEEGWIHRHLDAVLALPSLDIPAIRSRRFRVVVDCVNASGGAIVPLLLGRLGCESVLMNCGVDGVFAHPPEPVPENLTALAERVRNERADLGIAVDPDADRLVLITEQGEPYGEEYTIATVIRFVLGRERARGITGPLTVVVNLSTTRAVEDIAAAYGAAVVRTPVGEINVARRMLDTGAVIGGEGSGGVILPSIHPGRDAMVGIPLILQMLLEHGGPLSALRAALPRYAIAKGKIHLTHGSPDRILNALQGRYAATARINTDDGLRIDFPDSWVHLRKSNTEPVVRVIAEARSQDEAAALLQTFSREIGSEA
jgi:phosphomannomutase